MKTPIKTGDTITIKKEWMDAGDENYNFVSIEDQVDGMNHIKTRAFHKVTGERSAGIQSIELRMIEK